MIRQALVLAAGFGGRLVPNGLGPPKSLTKVAGLPLLSRVLGGLEAAGVKTAWVVLGHRGEEIESFYRAAHFSRLQVRWLPGADPNRSNGMSVLHARSALRKPFLLLMGDHLAELNVLQRLAAAEPDSEESILCVDRKCERVFDLEEATKVKLEGDRIVAIGKQLAQFDAADTGFFVCSPALFDALAASLQEGDCSLSDGIRELARRRRMRALDIGQAEWIDIDTPEALRQAETLLAAGKLCPPTS